MEVLKHTIFYERDQLQWSVYCLGDIHGGTRHCAEEELAYRVALIKADPQARWIDMGDKCEFISPGDPRWDIDVIDQSRFHPDNIAVEQTDWYCEVMSPIRAKCLGLLEGNHEDAIRTHSHIDVHANICRKLGLPNLGYSAFIPLKFCYVGRNRQSTFVGMVTHGAGGAITKGAKLMRLQRLMDAFNADWYAHGHVHDIITDTKPYLGIGRRNQVRQLAKVGAMTGCFFRTYTQGVRASYGEKRNYPPTAIGCVRFVFDLEDETVRVESV